MEGLLEIAPSPLLFASFSIQLYTPELRKVFTADIQNYSCLL